VNKKVILALDNLDLGTALSISNQVKDKLLTVKVGLELYNLAHKTGIKKFNDIGFNNLFLDLKLQDIPNTIYRSILALKEIKFGYLTVMALGGNEMIKQAKKAANELDPNIKILAVTILTSLKNELSKMGFSSSVEDAVVQLAKNSSEADGYVCSALEAKLLREKVSKDKLIFCPGIRMPGDSKDDQARSASPALALQNGADACIMGRSLLQGGDVNKNLEKVLNSIK
jgi:orotidine-5'-phosphate decarboxylase